MAEDNLKFFAAPYAWIPGVWCLITYVIEGDTVSLTMLFERGHAKIFHRQDEATAYAKTL